MTKIVNYSTKFCLEGDCAESSAEIKGYASVFGNKNTWGDIIERGAFAEFIASMQDAQVTIPLVFEHKTDDVAAYIGTVDTVREDERGLYITASLADNENAEKVRALVDNDTLNDFSVGIIATDYEPLEDGGDTIKTAMLREVSIVLTGADREAKIEKMSAEPTPPEQGDVDKAFSAVDEQAESVEETPEAEPVAEPTENETAETVAEETAEPETEQEEETTTDDVEETDEQANETEEEPAEQEDFSDEEETSEETEKTETVTEKEYSMTKIETPEALPKKMTAGQSLIKQMKAEPKKTAYEIKAYSAGNADALKYDGAFQNVGDVVVSLTGYTGVDYIDLFTVIDTDSNALNLTKVDYTGKPAVTADAGLKAKITAAATPVTEVIAKIAGYLSVSSACVEDGLYREIDADLAELLAISRNEYLIGTALDEATEVTGTGDLYNDIINAAAGLRSKGAADLTLFVNPADAATLQAGQGQGCCGLIADRLAPWGITRIEFSEEVEAGKFVLGDFKAQRVYRRTPIRVERATQSEDHFIYDIDDYRVYQRLGLFVRRPDLLVKSAA